MHPFVGEISAALHHAAKTSSSWVLQADRRAVFEVLFILRASDPNGGRWSGQVAFPGGHAEGGESDVEAVVRECEEELGLHLENEDNYTMLGRVNDRIVNKGVESLCISCLLFLQHNSADSKA
eukprot:gene16280-15227_t